MSALPAFSAEVCQQVDARLDSFLGATQPETEGLIKAMRYAVLNGGKRLRPVLVFAAATTCGKTSAATLNCACAVELIHAYSLVHDDLPAMDNDDLRRGQPTLHIAFDEATAILAGDALQTAAFELLAQADFATLDQAGACFEELARASGAQGMAGGQYIDLRAVGTQLSVPQLETMHRLKTGALIAASVRLGVLTAGLERSSAAFTKASEFGKLLGLAFQIKDDLLDATGTTETIGKRSGADATLNKPNFVSLLGVEGAQTELQRTSQQALEIAHQLGSEANLLTELVHFVANRKL